MKSRLSWKSQQEITCGDNPYPENGAGSAQATSSALDQDMCFHEAFGPPYELFPGSPGSMWSHSLDPNLTIGARTTGQGQEEQNINQDYTTPGEKRPKQDQSLLETANPASVLAGGLTCFIGACSWSLCAGTEKSTWGISGKKFPFWLKVMPGFSPLQT